MLSPQAYSQVILNASKAAALDVLSQFRKMRSGCVLDLSRQQCAMLKINNAKRCLNLGDVSSVNAVGLYNDLKAIAGTAGATLNALTQPPLTTSIVYVSTKGRVNFGDIPFVNTVNNPGFTISNWQANYYNDYGNKPDFRVLDNMGNLLVGDSQTPPQYNYVTPNDPTSSLVSVHWDFAPVAMTGFIRIIGQRQV